LPGEPEGRCLAAAAVDGAVAIGSRTGQKARGADSGIAHLRVIFTEIMLKRKRPTNAPILEGQSVLK